jgi:hypothetical protein
MKHRDVEDRVHKINYVLKVHDYPDFRWETESLFPTVTQESESIKKVFYPEWLPSTPLSQQKADSFHKKILENEHPSHKAAYITWKDEELKTEFCFRVFVNLRALDSQKVAKKLCDLSREEDIEKLAQYVKNLSSSRLISWKKKVENKKGDHSYLYSKKLPAASVLKYLDDIKGIETQKNLRAYFKKESRSPSKMKIGVNLSCLSVDLMDEHKKSLDKTIFFLNGILYRQSQDKKSAIVGNWQWKEDKSREDFTTTLTFKEAPSIILSDIIKKLFPPESGVTWGAIPDIILHFIDSRMSGHHIREPFILRGLIELAEKNIHVFHHEYISKACDCIVSRFNSSFSEAGLPLRFLIAYFLSLRDGAMLAQVNKSVQAHTQVYASFSPTLVAQRKQAKRPFSKTDPGTDKRFKP